MKFPLKMFLVFYLIALQQANDFDVCRDESNKYLQNYLVSGQENVTCSKFSNFKTFDELILDCNQTYNITNYVVMWPKNPLLIDKTFQLDKLFNQSQIDSIKSLNIGNLKGIDLNSKTFVLNSNRFKQRKTLSIYYSKLDIYSNSILIDLDECNLNAYNSKTNFFRFAFTISIQNVNYPRIWCPYFFHNFDLSRLYFFEITNSFLIKNRLNFFQLNESTNVCIKYLRKLEFGIQYESLTKHNLCPDLFMKTLYIGVTGILNGIQDNLFDYFPHLNNIDFIISNLRELFHGGNKWMNGLNVNSAGTLKKSLRLEFRHEKQMRSFDSIYEYPDEDLCLFKEFPHERSVYPLIVPGKRLECTCTLYWLQANILRYENEIKQTFNYNLNFQGDEQIKNVFIYCDALLFNSSECHFEQRFLLCKILKYNGIQEHV